MRERAKNKSFSRFFGSARANVCLPMSTESPYTANVFVQFYTGARTRACTFGIQTWWIMSTADRKWQKFIWMGMLSVHCMWRILHWRCHPCHIACIHSGKIVIRWDWLLLWRPPKPTQSSRNEFSLPIIFRSFARNDNGNGGMVANAFLFVCYRLLCHV